MEGGREGGTDGQRNGGEVGQVIGKGGKVCWAAGSAILLPK